MIVKYLLGIFLSMCTLTIFGQSFNEIDNLVYKIYNLDFKDVEKELKILEKTDPQIAGYLKFDYLWWKMISSNSDATESEFVAYKNTYNVGNRGGDKNFNTLIYYLYQIRYENFKKVSLSKYWTALKCQVFIQKINVGDATNFKPLEKAIFQLIVEFDKCLKYSIIDEVNFIQTKNEKNLHSSLEKIERIDNENYKSFNTIKNYFLGKIYLEISHDSIKANEKFSKLTEEFPDNVVLKEIKDNCRSDHSVIRL